jgi:hypothetical protein
VKVLMPLHSSSKKRIDQITTFSTPFYSRLNPDSEINC